MACFHDKVALLKYFFLLAYNYFVVNGNGIHCMLRKNKIKNEAGIKTYLIKESHSAWISEANELHREKRTTTSN